MPLTGKSGWVSSVFNPHFAPNGEIIGVISIVRHITERKRAEEALRGSEQSYRELADSIADVFFAMDKDLKYTYWNKASEDLTGILAKDAIGKSLYQLFPNIAGTPWEKLYLEALRSGQPGSLVDEYMIKGQLKSLEIDAYPSRNGLSVFVKDVTERRRAEEALRESEDCYRDLVENSQDLICTHDLEGRILSSNEPPARSLGYERYERSDLLKMRIQDILAPEVRGEFSEYVAVLRRDGVAKGLMLVQTAAGERRIWEYNSTLRTEGVPTPVVRRMAHDVTERIRAERALRRSEAQYRTLFENANDAILIFEPESEIILEANQRACESYGFSRQELVGMSLKKLTKDVPRGERQIGEILRVGSYLNFETVHFRRDGTPIDLLVSSSVIEYGDRKVILSIMRDVTERKQAEEALRKSAQLLKDTGEMARVGGWELDLSTKEVSWTDEVGRIHGVGPGYEPTLEKAMNFYAPESRPALEEALKKAAETGEPYDLESLFIPSGSKDKIWVRSLGRAVWSGGKVVKLAGTFQNIDKYKKVEEALRESEKLYRLLAENVTDVIWITDLDLRYRYISPSVMRLRGFTVEEAMAEKVEETLTPSSRKAAKRALAEELSKESIPQ